VQRKLILVGLSLLIGCARQPPADIDRPEARHVHSRVSRGHEGEILLAATFSGGGAGDTTYQMLACPTGKPRCEVLASIAWDEEKIPELIAKGPRIYLVVNEGSRIGQYQSFSRTIPSLRLGGFYLRYRQPEGRKEQ
jgi:hypothetical protein